MHGHRARTPPTRRSGRPARSAARRSLCFPPCCERKRMIIEFGQIRVERRRPGRSRRERPSGQHRVHETGDLHSVGALSGRRGTGRWATTLGASPGPPRRLLRRRSSGCGCPAPARPRGARPGGGMPNGSPLTLHDQRRDRHRIELGQAALAADRSGPARRQQGKRKAQDPDRAGLPPTVRQATRAPRDRPPTTSGRPRSSPSRRWSTTAVHAASSWRAGAGERAPGDAVGLLHERDAEPLRDARPPSPPRGLAQPPLHRLHGRGPARRGRHRRDADGRSPGRAGCRRRGPSRT